MSPTGALTQADLNRLPAAPSGVATRLHNDPQPYYLPDDGSADLTAASIRALEHKKYLLGEHHGDGTWTSRTGPWGYVEKMREGVQWFTPEGNDERAAIATAAQNPVIALGQGQALEDIHAVALTKALMTQQFLGDYPNLSSTPDGCEIFNEHMADLRVYVRQYMQVAMAWLHGPGLPSSGRGNHFARAAGLAQEAAWMALPWAAMKAQPRVKHVSDKQASDLRPVIKEFYDDVLELSDTRPLGGGLLGFFQSRQGPDPMTNRAALTGLSKPTGHTNLAHGIASAVTEGNIVREAAMVRNITASAAPLLVQMGDNHVDSLAGQLGAGVVRVKRGVDFAAMTTHI
jgi:hypothetical protein